MSVHWFFSNRANISSYFVPSWMFGECGRSKCIFFFSCGSCETLQLTTTGVKTSDQLFTIQRFIVDFFSPFQFLNPQFSSLIDENVSAKFDHMTMEALSNKDNASKCCFTF